jgi:predicted site-specific integrase-resolvase
MNAKLKHRMVYIMKHMQSWHDNKNIYRHRTYIMYDSISFQGQKDDIFNYISRITHFKGKSYVQFSKIDWKI